MVLQQSVDVIWNEDTGPLAGLQNYSASLNLKLSEAAGTKPDGNKTPNWIDRLSAVGISPGTGTDCTLNQVNAQQRRRRTMRPSSDVSRAIHPVMPAGRLFLPTRRSCSDR